MVGEPYASLLLTLAGATIAGVGGWAAAWLEDRRQDEKRYPWGRIDPASGPCVPAPTEDER